MFITFLLSLFALYTPDEPLPMEMNGAIENITEAFNTGDAQKLSESFGSSIEITTPTGDGVYSKAQAKQVMQKFFSQYKAQSNQIIHNGTSNTGSKFIVFSYKTEKEEFRITIFLKQIGSDFQIQEIEIVKQL